MAYDIAVVGDRDSVLGFQALGLQAVPADTAEEARAALHRLAREKACAVIFLTETYAAPLEGDIARYRDELIPAIILIPGKEGSLGVGMNNIKRSVERAVGSDIL